MNEMLDSQLSAMFDDELPPAECELLARRLARDESLQARWRNYAVIGAAMRGEHGLALDTRLAVRVRNIVAAEPAMSGAQVASTIQGSRAARRAWQGIAGAAVAAGVAALSVFWLRAQPPLSDEPLVAQTAEPPVAELALNAADDSPETYVVPVNVDSRPLVQTAELANYVVAHSEFSAPLSRRNLLSTLVASESGTTSLETSSASEDDAQDAQ